MTLPLENRGFFLLTTVFRGSFFAVVLTNVPKAVSENCALIISSVLYLNFVQVVLLNVTQVVLDGRSCSSHYDCATEESCCGGLRKCATSCVGESCSYDVDCATGECCHSDNKCKSGDCDLTGWIYAVIGTVLVVVIILIIDVVFCCCRATGAAAFWRRPTHGGVIVTQPATTEAPVLATQQQ